jgi:hypothetical protein
MLDIILKIFCVLFVIVIYSVFVSTTTSVVVEKRLQKQAVELGYGKLLVNTNTSIWPPPTKFEWITNRVVK